LRPDKVKASVPPDLLFEAHSSTMDIVFYESEQFPPEYKGDAFVALKGSWNRSEPTGYKIVRVPFKDGKPQGYYQNFVTGFWVSGQNRAEVWGRPTAIPGSLRPSSGGMGGPRPWQPVPANDYTAVGDRDEGAPVGHRHLKCRTTQAWYSPPMSLPV
jgi:hypothetical protein